MHIIREMA